MSRPITTTCLGKVRYETAVMADLASRGIARRRRHGERMRSYRCPFCEGWHLTSVRKRSRAR